MEISTAEAHAEVRRAEAEAESKLCAAGSAGRTSSGKPAMLALELFDLEIWKRNGPLPMPYR